MQDEYEGIAKFDLLKYVKKNINFVSAIKKVQQWYKWESKYFCHFLENDWYSREGFRKYARYFYEEVWPFHLSNDEDIISAPRKYQLLWIDEVLNVVINTEGKPWFRLTVKEFDNVVKEITKNAESQGVNIEQVKEYFVLAIYKKTGEKVEVHKDIESQIKLAEIEKQAPKYIRESKLEFVNAKYELWQLVKRFEELVPDQKQDIEKIAKELAKQECVMNFEKIFKEFLFKARKESEYKSTTRKQAAENISNLVYDSKKESQQHKIMAGVLMQLKKKELIVILDELLSVQYIKEMREFFAKLGH